MAEGLRSEYIEMWLYVAITLTLTSALLEPRPVASYHQLCKTFSAGCNSVSEKQPVATHAKFHKDAVAPKVNVFFAKRTYKVLKSN